MAAVIARLDPVLCVGEPGEERRERLAADDVQVPRVEKRICDVGLDTVARVERTELAATAAGLTPVDVVAEVVAVAVVEWSIDHSVTIRMVIEDDRVAIVDSGRGLPPDRAPELHRIGEMTLTALSDVVWGARWPGGLPLAIAASRELSVTSRRDGEEWIVRFANGHPNGEPVRVATTARQGTVVRLQTRGPIDRTRVEQVIARLHERLPRLNIDLVAEPSAQ